MKKVTNFIKTALLEIKLKSFKNQQELVLVTGSSSSHFKSLYQLLKSIQKFEKNTKTIVYDLGLKQLENENLLKEFPNIDLRKFDFSKYPEYFNININDGVYAWKPVIFDEVFNEFKCSVCWIDAGNVITQKLILLRKVIKYYGFYSPFSKGKIDDWTHPESLKTLGVYNDLDLRKQINLNGACISADYNHKEVNNVITKWKEGALTKNCIAPKGSSRANHRFDQAVLSVLVYKHIPEIGKKMTFKRFGFKIHQDIDE
ncbi:DUF1647 domain-containing protein [Polaribacter sp. Asnod6-C07]|uniref:DUF1647 domain-containing protein n=1 Tax=Polaribacter sp. Asnod6-C07 TaxID=3160582 RepID=UPI00386C8F55